MTPDIPHNIRIRLAQSKKNFVVSWRCKIRMQQNNFSMGPILFLYYEESLVSSNLNSKLFRFHSAHSILHTCSLSSWLLSAVSFKSLFSIRRLSICFSILANLSSFPFIILCWILSSSTNFKSLCRFLISCFALLNSPLSFSNSIFCWESSLGSCVTT